MIRNVTPNISTLSLPFARFGIFKVGGRATIGTYILLFITPRSLFPPQHTPQLISPTLVRLTSGALAIFSPVKLTPEVRTHLQTLGNNVRYITAPDIEHHIYLGEWHVAYPDATIIGPSGLPEKRASQKLQPAVPFHVVFTPENKRSLRIGPDFDADFDYEYVHAHANKELVFNYRPDRTLIQADLFFNLPAREQYSRTGESPTAGIPSRFFAGLMSTAGNAFWQKRFVWWVSSSADRKAFGESVRRIEAWDWDRVVPCHGEVIESGGKGVFRKVFEWFLNAKDR